MKLNRTDKPKIVKMAQSGDYESIVGLLDHYISESLEQCVECTTDHRFVQGKMKALTKLREEIVMPKPE